MFKVTWAKGCKSQGAMRRGLSLPSVGKLEQNKQR